MRRYRIVPIVGLAAVMVMSVVGTAVSGEPQTFKAEFRDPSSPDVVITPCVESGRFSVLPYRMTKVTGKKMFRSAEITFHPFTGAGTGAPSSDAGSWVATIHATSVGLISPVKSKAGGSWAQVPIEAKAPTPGTYDWPATASDKPDPKPGGKSKFVMTGTIPRVVVVAASGFPGNCPLGSTPIPGTDSPTTGGGTGGAGAAGAAKKAFTKLTIKHRSPFHGRVRSSDAACKDGRKVQLFKKRPKRKVGADRTGRNGKWRISGKRFSQGRFFARVKGTTVGNTTCTPARSRTIRLRA